MEMEYNKPCKICGSINQILFDDEDRKSIFCQDCKNFEDIYASEELQKYWDKQEQLQIREQQSSKPTVECPYCHSTDTKKITNMSKVGSVALFGVYAMGKVSKQWKCNSCKSNF